MPHTAPAGAPASVLRDLAQFRYRLRLFLRFSERAARAAGVTPLQHQLMLGVAGFTGRGWATIGELTECLQERHNAVVALVTRAVSAGLVRKRRDPADRRVVRVELTARGRRVLLRLAHRHREELARFPRGGLLPSAGRRGAR
ncbi:MAG: MarR family transcriptional regulator [Gemmatimonadota bacterium]|nr:MarR family transcriptional regulator [Gemmatimonadota bacterium]MDE3172928.1 MarR family transcriptional regulator [Gemmatimonadota bacterium]MDE3217023.1 MarR family transcriptional regulator [Gemmatimonadota bacterium]